MTVHAGTNSKLVYEEQLSDSPDIAHEDIIEQYLLRHSVVFKVLPATRALERAPLSLTINVLIG